MMRRTIGVVCALLVLPIILVSFVACMLWNAAITGYRLYEMFSSWIME